MFLIAPLLALIPGGSMIAGAVGGVASYILQCRTCMILLGLLIAFAVGDIRGHQKANATCQAAALQAKLDAAQRDAKISAAAAQAAKDGKDEADKLALDLQEKLKENANEIAKLTGAQAQCRAATDADSRRLHNLAAPARR